MGSDQVTLRMEEEHIEILDQMSEEGYIDSRSHGIRYALDRKLETNNPEYNPITEPDEEIEERFRELGEEYGLEKELPEAIVYEQFFDTEFREDSFEFAKEVLTRAVVTEDEEMEQLAKNYLQENFDETQY